MNSNCRNYYHVQFIVFQGKDEKRSAGQPLALPFKQLELPTTTRAPIFYKRNTPIAMTEAKSLPLGVPAFRPLKTPALPNLMKNVQSIAAKKQNDLTPNEFNRKAALYQFQAPNLSAANLSFIQSQMTLQNHHTKKRVNPMVISPQANAFKVPAFQALPSSVSRISTGQIVHANSNIGKMSGIQRVDVNYLLLSKHFSKLILFYFFFSLQTFNSRNDQNEAFSQKVSVTARPLPQVDLKGHTVEELAAVANVSVAAIRKAIEMRQIQLMAEQEEQMRKQAVVDEAKREEQIAQQLALYQQEHQKFIATSTVEAPTTTVRTTTAGRQTRPTRPTSNNKNAMAGGSKVSWIIFNRCTMCLV